MEDVVRGLHLIGDEIALDGVVLFKATANLTPRMRMRLRDMDILTSDGHVRHPAQSLDPHDEYRRGRSEGYAMAVKDAQQRDANAVAVN